MATTTLVVAGAPAATAAPVVEPDAAQDLPVADEPAEPITERPDGLSAVLTARSQGARVEDLSQRTESTSRFANPDGTWTFEDHGTAVRVEREGKWVDVDYSLVRGAEGSWAPVASAVQTLVSGGGTTEAGMVTFADGTSLAVTWPEELPEPAVDGGVATFAVSETTDLLVMTTANGLNAWLRLNEAPPAGADQFEIGLETNGVSLLHDEGTMTMLDKTGKRVGSTSNLVAWDAREDRAGEPAEVVQLKTDLIQVGRAGAGAVRQHALSLEVPEGFLDDPQTQYPVVIDPNISAVTTVRDTWVRSGNTQSKINDHRLVVGPDADSPNQAVSYIKWHPNQLTGTDVISATMSLYQYYSESCVTSKSTVVYPLGSAFDSLTVWTNRPAVITASATSTSFAGNRGPGCSLGKGTVTADVTAIARAWASGALDTHGLRMGVPNGSTTDTTFAKRFCSLDPSSASTDCNVATRVPRLSVTYNSAPSAPVALSYTQYFNTSNPTLETSATDPENSRVKYTFEAYSSNTLRSSCTSGLVAAGTIASCSLVTALGEGTYTARVRATDERGLVGPWSAGFPIHIDTTPPAPPVISATRYSDGQWSLTTASDNQFTFVSSADVRAFEYSQNFEDWETLRLSIPYLTGGQGELDWAPEAGAHTLTVRAVDHAGSTSVESTFSFGSGPATLTLPDTGVAIVDSLAVVASGPPALLGTVIPRILVRPSGTPEPRDFDAAHGSDTGWIELDSLGPIATGVTPEIDTNAALDALHLAMPSPLWTMRLDVQVCFNYSASKQLCTWTAEPASHHTVLRMPVDVAPETRLVTGTTRLHLATDPRITDMRFEWRSTDEASATIHTIPPADLSHSGDAPWTGVPPAPQPELGQPPVLWEISNTVGHRPIIEVRAVVSHDGFTTNFFSPWKPLQHSATAMSPSTVMVGPAEVDLADGRVAMSTEDIGTDQLSLRRTLGFGTEPGSADMALPTHGWRTYVGVAGIETSLLGVTFPSSSAAVVHASDPRHSIRFVKSASEWTQLGPEQTATLKMQGASYVVRIASGPTYQFAPLPDGTYVQASVTLHDGISIRTERTAQGDASLVTRVVAGTAACTETQTSGCARLEMTHEDDPHQDGASRLAKVTLIDHTDEAGALVRRTASYSYDATGKLQRVITETGTAGYTYDTAGRLLIATNSGLKPYVFDYAQESQSKPPGALARLSVPAEDARNTYLFDYRENLTSAAGGPYDMTEATVRQWGQVYAATSATRVHGPLPSTTQPAGLPGADEGGTTYYLNPMHQTVNRAMPPGPDFADVGFVDTWQYDLSGAVEDLIGPTERARFLRPEEAGSTEPIDPGVETGEYGDLTGYETPTLISDSPEPEPPRFQVELPVGAHLAGMSFDQMIAAGAECAEGADSGMITCTTEGPPDAEFSAVDYETGAAPKIYYSPNHGEIDPTTGLAMYVAPMPISPACYSSFKATHTTRFMSCRAQHLNITAFVRASPAGGFTVAGRYEGAVITTQYMTWDRELVVLQADAKLTRTTGLVVGAFATARYSCHSSCSDVDRGLMASVVLSKNSWSKVASSVSPALGPGKVGYVKHRYDMKFVAIVPGAVALGGTAWMSTATHEARCDNGVARSGTRGCVVSGSKAEPVVYSKTGKYPELARHIDEALNSGLKGGSVPLTRTSSGPWVAANRRVACPTALPKFSGRDCDEYPFASTKEGAASGGVARVFPNCHLSQQSGRGAVGFSRCMVLSSQNRGAGAVLGWHYAKQRILDGDKFHVRITR